MKRYWGILVGFPVLCGCAAMAAGIRGAVDALAGVATPPPPGAAEVGASLAHSVQQGALLFPEPYRTIMVAVLGLIGGVGTWWFHRQAHKPHS